MTRTRTARLAGILFLLYIVTGISSMILTRPVTAGVHNDDAKLAAYARHAGVMRADALLTFLCFFYAVGLAVTIYGLTRDIDRELALLAFSCRLTEGVINAFAAIRTLGIVSIATAGAAAANPGGAQTGGGLLLQADGSSTLVSATCFAVGSTIYCWLFLRARSIPLWMAWLGVAASGLLVIGLPLQILTFVPDTIYMWMPMLVFELTFAFWLIFKGIAAPSARAVAGSN